MAVVLASPLRGEVIAEYTGAPTNAMVVSTAHTQAMAFDVGGSPTVTEIQLNLRRWSGSTGYMMMQLRRDSDGAPSDGSVAQISRLVTDIPEDAATWFSFKWTSSGTTISPGRWWIVCKVSSYSDAEIDWQTVSGNPYGTGDDTKHSGDGGATWPVIQGTDANFKVFGARSSRSTTTAITIDPSPVPASGVATIDVTVRDAGGSPVPAGGRVSLSKSGGSWVNPGALPLTLDANGTASTTWRAPASVGSQTITAQYQGDSYAGVDYDSSSLASSVGVIADDRGTTVTLTLSANSIQTRDQITASLTVRDDQNNLVPGGTVSFDDGGRGEFGLDSINLVNGQGSTTWTAGNAVGTFPITAYYSGFDDSGGSGIVYGPDDDFKNVTVDYTDMTTTTSVRLSPAYPYIGKTCYVIVTVTDSGGNPVPGGSVQLTADPISGWFDANPVPVSGGAGSTLWHAPNSAGDVNITGDYQQHIAGGNRYLTSSSWPPTVAHVTADSDSTGTDLSWMSEWNTDYTDNPLTNTRPDARGFTGKLTAAADWTGSQYANRSAWEDHMKKDEGWFSNGRENSFLDTHDFTYYSGHGNPDWITFITEHAPFDIYENKKLRHSEAYDAWGTKDAEWVAFSACKVMSHDSHWASTMNGIHLECGFHTNMDDTAIFGHIFASLLVKESLHDEPHPIHQAWFLAGDQTHYTANRVKQRVIGEHNGMFDDYLWGQGYVSPDPAVDNWYDTRVNDVVSNFPVANAGGPYNATAGQWFQLDGSASFDPDVGDYLTYVWDMDPATNTDALDWDHDGIDEVDDDWDAAGRRPWWRFSTAGNYNIRLTIHDDDWKTSSAWAVVNVAARGAGDGGSRSGPREVSTNGGLEIVDNFPALPAETQMPLVQVFNTALGHNELLTIAGYYGVQGAAGLDELGNWTMTEGDHELIVNQHSGSVLYADRARAYIYNTNGPPPALPSDTEAIAVAEAFLDANSVLRVGAVLDGISEMYAEQTQKGSRTRLSSIPYQRRVNYRRTIDVGQPPQPYPVVGPGGRITVMMDETRDIVLYVRVWREAYSIPQAQIDLYPPDQAIAEFHRLGIKALIGGSWVPPSNRIEIDSVSLGYYEDDFVTAQPFMLPVYVLDITCEDDVGSQRTQVYLPAVAPPLEASIDAPSNGLEVAYGTPIALSGSSTNGTPPYTYEWDSDRDGFLGTNGAASALLSVNLQEGEVLEHTITLRVTDQSSFFAEDRIRVKVVPSAGDLDGEGDVDGDDYALFSACLAGPEVTSNGPGCSPGQFNLADLEGDGDVDLGDFARFQQVYTGPGVCGNGLIEGDEECDDAGESLTCNADCTVAQCGDGTINVTTGEECDDGGESATCDADCTLAQCGDGTINVTTGEECDDGGESAICDADCTVAVCGDGTINPTTGEECDDGGESAACDADCTAAQCGDGTINTTAGEECDDAGESAVCDGDCTIALCGDGTTNATSGEECDDGGESAACDADCTVAQCGDGAINVTAGEECDDGGESATCDVDCTAATCGDGVLNVTAGEECDDANTNGGDGCAADCTLEGAPLPECVLDFDSLPCPNSAQICGTFFSGPGDCVPVGGNCTDTPPGAYRLTPGAPLMIMLDGDLNTLSVFFTGFFGSVGVMEFLDDQGLSVDAPLYTNGDCVSGSPPPQFVAFSRPVRAIQVYVATGTYVFIDTFHVNPP